MRRYTTGEGPHWGREVRRDGRGIAFCGASTGLKDAEQIVEALNRQQVEEKNDLHERAMTLLHEAAGIERDGLAGLLAWIQDSRVVREDVARLRDKLNDREARLKAVRDISGVGCFASDALEPWERAIKHATDLRRKEWRKP